MHNQTQIISEQAKRECQRISTSVIRQLQKLRGDSLLSGDDSVLKNTWDEICVQIQGERSIFWDVYLATIQHNVGTAVSKLSSDNQTAIWFQTENGYFWDADEDEEPKTIFEDVVRYIIQEFVFVEAGRWTNYRIEQYIDQH